ncbi:hypothetical protein BH10BAC5_BH10BAC5_23930 [soil metagenome]
MKTIFFSLAIMLFVNIATAQIPGSPLKVSGNTIRDNNNNPFVLKAINLNDYIENAYSPWGSWYHNQSFQTVLSWLHTSDDYQRIKQMGFNSVRLNICPSHIKEIPNLQRLKDNILWAKQNNLHLIIAYFAPPGSIAYNGYYQEKGFYNNQDSIKLFQTHWGKIMKLCKDSNYSHVMYEFLNEPQIGYVNNESYQNLSAYWKRSIYKDIMISLLDTMARIGDPNRVLIIDGLSYALPDYKGFKYLKTAINRNNIVYSFHYYMNDFAFRGCNWNIGNLYTHRTEYSESNTGWDTISFNINTDSLNGVLQPQVVLSSFDQIGSYKVKYFEIKDNVSQAIKFSLDMGGKVIFPEGDSNHYFYDGPRKFYLGYGGTWGSSQRSNMYIHNNTSLAMANTIKPDTSINTGDYNWSAMVFDNSNANTPFTLQSGRNYTCKLIIDGDSISDNGGFVVQFKLNSNTTVHEQHIENLRYDNYSHIEKIISSYPDRIKASFLTMKQFSDEFNVPIFLGEFGIPILQRESHTFDYLRQITMLDNIYNFSWAYFVYREPNKNDIPESTYVTLGLYSGIDKNPNPNATVCRMVHGITTGQTVTNLTNTAPYYWNKYLIDTLTRNLSGSYATDCISTDINIHDAEIPIKFSLEQNYPNPFNPNTEIRYSLPFIQIVKIILYDVLGKEVRIIVDETQQAGYYSVNFNAAGLTSGIYYYKIFTDNFSETRKMVILK